MRGARAPGRAARRARHWLASSRPARRRREARSRTSCWTSCSAAASPTPTSTSRCVVAGHHGACPTSAGPTRGSSSRPTEPPGTRAASRGRTTPSARRSSSGTASASCASPGSRPSSDRARPSPDRGRGRAPRRVRPPRRARDVASSRPSLMTAASCRVRRGYRHVLDAHLPARTAHARRRRVRRGYRHVLDAHLPARTAHARRRRVRRACRHVLDARPWSGRLMPAGVEIVGHAATFSTLARGADGLCPWASNLSRMPPRSRRSPANVPTALVPAELSEFLPACPPRTRRSPSLNRLSARAPRPPARPFCRC